MRAVKTMVHPSSSEPAGREGTRVDRALPEAPGRVLGGRYRLIRQLGVGGMGSVWLCEHVALGRRYALKVLNADRAADPELVERFRQEARSASRISQENVVDVVDCGDDPGGEHFYVMEVLDGRTLGQVMREEGPLPVGRALALLEQVCRALAAAHGRGVVHCDVKPDNVLVERLPDGRERAKLIDFGISRAPDAGRLTRDGEVIGTPEYMSPEQAAGDQVDALTDVYATGVLAFELLTGCLPLVGPTAIATLVAHQTVAPPPPGQRRAGLSPEVDRLVLRALAKRPADRFPSMQAMAAEVLRARLSVGQATPDPYDDGRVGAAATLALPVTPGPMAATRAAPPEPAAPPAGQARRVRWLGLALGVLAASLAVAAAVAAVVFWTGHAAAPIPARPLEPPAATAPATAPAPQSAEEPAPPEAPRPIEDSPAASRRKAAPPRQRPPAEPPAHDPYQSTDTLKADPFK